MPTTPSKQRAPCSANNASPRDSAAMAAASPRAPDRGVIGTGALAAQSPKSHRHAEHNRPRRRPPRKIDCGPADLSPPQALSPRAGRPQAPYRESARSSPFASPSTLAAPSPHPPPSTLHPPPSTLHLPPSTLPNRPHPSPPYRRRNPTRCSTSSSRQAPTLFDKSSTRARLPKKRLENSPRGSPPRTGLRRPHDSQPLCLASLANHASRPAVAGGR